MTEEVHFIPVGFDYQRLLQPLAQDDFDPDRIELFFTEGTPGREAEAAYAESIVELMEESCRDSLGANVEVRGLKDIYDYQYLFKYCCDLIGEELDEGNEVFINISSMPRTVSFAFATAANSFIVQDPNRRNEIHIYYVSPEEYLVIEAKEVLENQLDLSERIKNSTTDIEVEPELAELENILSRLAKGVTEGVTEFNGKHHVEFVATPGLGVEGVPREILEVIARCGGELESISDVSRKHGELFDKDGDTNSHIKNIRYHIQTNLVPMGFVNEDKDSEGRKHPISLSKIGEMWAIAQPEIDYEPRSDEEVS